MFNLSSRSTRVNRSQFETTVEQICIVRNERGRRAQGDPLLRSSLRSLSNSDKRSALIALKQFRETPDLSNQHRLIIAIAIDKLRSPWISTLKILRQLNALLSYIVIVMRLLWRWGSS
jgi:hypothetical protein